MSITLMRRRKTSSSSAAKAPPPTPVPPVLPVVTMTVQADASLSVAVDGRRFDPPAFGPRWQRHSVAQIINEVMEQRHSPVRVVINEQDGSVFTDLVTQPIRETPPSKRSATSAPVMAESDIEMPVHVLAVRGDEGFVAGEQVAVAVIVRHTVAEGGGSARSLIEPGLLDLSPTREVILLGRVSGTWLVGQPT